MIQIDTEMTDAEALMLERILDRVETTGKAEDAAVAQITDELEI